jgi:Fur family ferric uptake transcriptional regulator
VNRSTDYNTRQREAVLNYLKESGGAHLSAAKIAEHLKGQDGHVGRTTVYRCLERLVEGGSVRRFVTDGNSACYQYIGERDDCHAHLHLKCELCGELRHVECDVLDDISRHFRDMHAFRMNILKTVLYGTCERCANDINGR